MTENDFNTTVDKYLNGIPSDTTAASSAEMFAAGKLITVNCKPVIFYHLVINYFLSDEGI